MRHHEAGLLGHLLQDGVVRVQRAQRAHVGAVEQRPGLAHRGVPERPQPGAVGGRHGHLHRVGCEPAKLEHEDGYIGLSTEVGATVDEAIRSIESLIQEAFV